MENSKLKKKKILIKFKLFINLNINIIEKNTLIKFIFIIFTIITILLLFIDFEYLENDNEITFYEKNIDYSNLTTDIKTIVLYLPQFHSIKKIINGGERVLLNGPM
jgi:hypothetical protein